MPMKRPSAGYTILESMIFLAVSGVLFALVIPSISSRQDKIRFSETVRDLNTKIQDVINDVSTGYFPSGSVKCTVSPPLTGTIDLDINGGSEQGTRKDCIFLGKVVAVNGLPSNSAHHDQVNIFTVVGKRQANGQNVKTLPEATPTAVAHTPTSPDNYPELTESYTTKWSTDINNMVIVGPPQTPIGSFGIMSRLDSGGNALGQVDIIPVDGTLLTDDNRAAAQKINTEPMWDNRNPQGGILICLVSPYDSNQKAAILVGGRAGNAKTEVVFDKPNIDSSFGGAPCG